MPRVKGNSPGYPSADSASWLAIFSCVYRRSTGRPESVVNLSWRSAGLVLASDMEVGKSKMEVRKGLSARRVERRRKHGHNLRALRKEVTEKNRNSRATATARPMSQRAT